MSGARGAGIAFVAAFLAFYVQILLHRVLSAKLLGNYVFLVVSLAMLGLAVSGVVLSRARRIFEARDEAIATSAGLFAISTIAGAMLVYRIQTGSQFATTRPDYVWTLLLTLPLTLTLALPFLFVGVILGVLLASKDLSADRIYFADLVGSALGALVILPTIAPLGVERDLALACACMAAGVAVLTRPKSLGARGVVLVAVAVSALALALPSRVFRMVWPRGSMLAEAPSVEHVAWDALGRVELSPVSWDPNGESDFPALRGRNTRFKQRLRRMITHNNYAFTYAFDYDGTKSSLEGIEETLYAAPYQVRAVASPRVVVLGAGGGIDVLSALAFDARHVTAVEVNHAVVDMLRGRYRSEFGRWVDDPRVRLEVDEGRHFLASRDERFDVIQLTSVESGAGAPSSAQGFSEAFVHTQEAFSLYLDRLSDEGILSVMHIEQRVPREMLRALTTAVSALRKRGVDDPARHVVTLTAQPATFVSVLVKKSPFTDDELQRLEAWAQGRAFSISASPRMRAEPSNVYQAFLALGADDQARFIESYPFDISPVDDDRPYFFRSSFWWHLFPAQGLVWETVPYMEYCLVVLFALIAIAGVVFVYWPVRRLGDRLAHPRKNVVFFGGIGVGYLFIEIALMQKLGLLLGHPSYAISVVLATMLFASGLGALGSRSIVRLFTNLRFVVYAIATLIFLECFAVLPLILHWVGASLVVRVGIVVALVAPLGVLMGTFMPTAIESLKRDSSEAVAWAWGVNGVFSVMAPVLAMAFAMSWGTTALLLASIPFYLAAGFASPLHEPS